MMRMRVLVVDDDPDVCAFLEDLLREQDYEVVTVSQPGKVTDMLRAFEFHMMTLDLSMPGLDGLELLREVRTFNRELRVVILTGNASVETAAEACSLGVSGYLQKPFSGATLLEKTRSIASELGLLARPEDEIIKLLGANIRQARRDGKMTLKDMATRSGLSVAYLSRIERGEVSMTVVTLYRVADALGVHVSDVLRGL